MIKKKTRTEKLETAFRMMDVCWCPEGRSGAKSSSSVLLQTLLFSANSLNLLCLSSSGSLLVGSFFGG